MQNAHVLPNRTITDYQITNEQFTTIKVPMAYMRSDEDYNLGIRKKLRKVMLPNGSTSLINALILYDYNKGGSSREAEISARSFNF